MRNFLNNNLPLIFFYCLALFTALFFIGNYEKHAINIYINSFVGNKLLNDFFFYITYLGDGRMAGAILLLVVLYNVRTGIYATCSFLSAAIASNLLKYFFFDDAHRPSYVFKYIELYDIKYIDGTDVHLHNSFPSGHATQAFAIFMSLAFSASSQWVKMLYFLLAVLTAFSRVYLSQHWLVDITAGSVIGLVFSLLFYFVFLYRNKLGKLDRPASKFRAS